MKKHFKYLKFLISILVLTIVFYQVDFRLLFARIFQIKPLIIILSICILIIQSALSSFKWQIILKGENKSVPFLYLLNSYLIGNFMSLFLPSSFGGDVYRVYSLQKHNDDYLKNAATVIFDRLTGLFALSSLSVISFSLFFKEMINYYFFIVYLLCILFFWFASSKFWINKYRKYDNKYFSLFTKIFESFSRYRYNFKILFPTLIIAFLFQNNIVLMNKLYCYGLNINIDLTFLYMVIPLVYLTEALPISINGLGVREGAFVFFLGQSGYPKEQALALALLVISIRYIFIIASGGTLFLLALLKTSSGKT